MGPLTMLFSLQASTGATILERQIASTSTTGWRTIGLVWHALTCRKRYRRGQSPTRRRQRDKSLALPNNLVRFERHESIWMVRDDACGVVARGARCGDLSRICVRALCIWAGSGWVHDFKTSGVSLILIGVELYSQVIRSEGTRSNVGL